MANHFGLEGTTLSPSLPENHTSIQVHTSEVSSLSDVAFCFSESTKYIILSPEKVLELKKGIEELSRRIQNLEFRRCYSEGLHSITEGCGDAVKELTTSEHEQQSHGDQVSQLQDLKYQLLTTQKRFLEHIAAVFRREYADSHSLRNEVSIISEGGENKSTNLQERPVTGYDDPRTRKSDKKPCSGMDPTSPTHEANDFPEGPHEMPKENEGDSNYTRTPLKTLQDFNDHPNNIETRFSVEVLNKNESAGLALTQDEESHTSERHSTIEDSERRLVFSEEISASSEGGSDEEMNFTDNSTSQDVVYDDAFENDSSDDGEANKSVTDAESEYESGIQDTGNNDGRFLSKSTGKRQIQLNESRSQQGRDIQGLEGTLEDIAENNPQDAKPIPLIQTSTEDTCDLERGISDRGNLVLAPEEAVQDKAGNESSLGGIIAGLTTGAAAAKTLQGFVDRFCAEKLNQICANGCKEELEHKNYIKTELDSLVEVLDEAIKLI